MQDRIQHFEAKLKRYTEADRKRIMEAVYWAEEKHRDQKRASGAPYFIHPLKVAELLVDMQMDGETIIAALLHDVLEDTGTSESEMKKRFGRAIVALVDGVTKISIVKAKSKSIQQTETMRKMLMAMTKDIRVIIIKLADKFHNMSTLEHLPPKKQREIATECLEVYAPLAGRLGISWLKAELEDLSLKHLKPDVYRQIQERLYDKQHKNRTYLKRVEREILKAARETDIDIKVAARTKHIYSVYKKMKSRKKDIDDIHDILGIRVICRNEAECYSMLGLVHRLWPPVEGRFKDYIAMPKANQYRSLHTTVISWDGRKLEVQIRTQAMHWTAEYGVAAHWAYKREMNREKVNPEDLLIINKLKEWKKFNITGLNFWEEIKGELLRDSIYVFTPKGHIVELPKDSTPLDFAYHIHTEVGNHCIGAKADQTIISLNTPLKNTQIVEILTANTAKPNTDWLRYAKTSRARSKIRHWLNQHEEDLVIDRNIIAKKNAANLDRKPQPAQTPPKEREIIKRVLDRAKVGFRIGNEKNMLISLAKCCNPSTGDDIIGYVSRGRGIIVHRRDCTNLEHIKDFENRSVEVEWEAVSPRTTRRFEVTSKITSDLFSEIEGAVKKYGGHLIEGRLEESEQEKLIGSFIMEMERTTDYKKILKSIRTIPSILNLRPLN